MLPLLPNELLLPRESSSPRSQQDESALPTLPNEDPPKRKRGRITKEQLAKLERFFFADCSPTVAHRREIALQVGCPERQIQVWFQNRRAKAKNNGEKCRTSRPRVPSPVKEPPELCQAIQTDLAMLIQEDDSSVLTIPCTTLTIGGWNRVNYKDQHDLLAWVCEKKKCFTWFIRSHDYSFKMQVPLDTLKELMFKNAEPGKAFLTLELSRPPTFFLRRNPEREEDVPPPCWRPCDDWTENKAATYTLRHVLRGPALPLANVVNYIKHQREDTKLVTLHPVAYPTPTEDHFSPHPNSASTATYPSNILDDTLYPRSHEPYGWDSTMAFAESQAPSYNTKPPPGVYQGLNRPRSETLYNMEHDKMGPSGAAVEIVPIPLRRLSPLHAPQPRPYYFENELNNVAHFQPSAYYPPNGSIGHHHHHHHPSYPLPHFSELFPASSD